MSDRPPDPRLDSPAIARRGSTPPSSTDLAARPGEGAFDQHDFRGRLDWGLAGVRQLAPVVDLVVIVDVLSFSTAVSIAVDQGARVVPFRSRDEGAAAHARSIGAVLASPNRNTRGPTLSPASLTTLRSGQVADPPSPNGGTCAVEAAESGDDGRDRLPSQRNCRRSADRRPWRFGGGHRLRRGLAGPTPSGRPWKTCWVAARSSRRWTRPGLSPESRLAAAGFRGLRGSLASALRDSASGRESRCRLRGRCRAGRGSGRHRPRAGPGRRRLRRRHGVTQPDRPAEDEAIDALFDLGIDRALSQACRQRSPNASVPWPS